MSKKIAAAFAAALALALFASPAKAQKALVYCPVGVDATGCDRIVAALQPKFPDGVDRGYDGTNSTIDLMKVDLEHYAVIVVPSLADDDTKQPYAVLRKVSARLHLAVNGRVAVYSGAPDQGSANRADKDAIIQNLATWSAKGHTRATGLVGLVAFLDLSENTSARYSWVKSVSLADVSADAETQSIADLTTAGRGGDLLASAGQAIRFSNMASYGLHIGARAAARTEVGAMSTATDSHQSVLVTYANADGKDLGMNAGRPGGASLDVSGGGAGSGPTLTTDKPDYLPGDTVLFSGTGWAPNDTVTITVHEDPQWSNPDRTVTAVADGTGNLSSHDFVVQQRDFGVTFTATAVGNPSGLVAQVTFTDGNASVSGTVTDAATHLPIAGATVSCLAAPATNPCNNAFSVTTDANGHYSTTNKLQFGGNGATVRLTAAATGYASLSIDEPLTNNNDQVLDFALTLAGPTKLAFPNAAVSGVVNQCLTINIQTQNAGGTPTAVTSNTAVNLTTDNGSTGAGAFYTSNACTTTTNTIQINSGSSSGTLFYEATTRGNGTHNLTVAATGLTQASQGETINKANQAALTITAPTTGIFGDKLTITTTGGSGSGALSLSAGASTACSIMTTPGPDLNKLQITSGTGTCSITATKAADNDFNSVTSAPQAVTVSKANQTITFGLLANKTFGDADFSVSATATSGLTVAFTVGTTDQCTVTGTTVHLTGAGSCTVKADQAGSDNYNAAPQVTQTFTIAKANQTITFAALANKTYGDPDFTVSATASSGLPVTFMVGTTDQCTISGTTVHLTGAGSCTVKADQVGNNNYNAAPQIPQPFTIAKKTVTVATLSANNKTYDGNNSATLTGGTLSGVVAGDEANVSLDISTATATFSDAFAGTAKLVTATGLGLSGGAKGNYVLSPTTATTHANIDQKSLTASITATGKEYDGTTTVTGTVNCSVATKVGTDDVSCTVSGAVFDSPNAGSRTVTANVVLSGGAKDNYTLGVQTTAAASATITQKALTIKADDKEKTYDALPFSPFTASYMGLIAADADAGPQPKAGVLSGSVTFGGTAVGAVNAGTYAITPQGVTATNYAISFNGGTLTIDRANATITAAGFSGPYDGQPHPGSCSATGVNNTGVPTNSSYTPGPAAPVNAGSYTATCAVSGQTNYNDASVNKYISITKVALTVKADDQNKTYDGTAFSPFTSKITGFVNNETGAGVVSGSITYGGPATTAVNAGTYAITPVVTGLAATNYTFTPTDGSLLIKQAPLTITATDKEKTYDGHTFTAFTSSFNGLIAVDADPGPQPKAGVLSTPVTYTGSAVGAVNVGSYTITPTGATATNYSITFNGGTLKVDKADPTVSVAGGTFVYNAQPHGATGSAKGVLGETLNVLDLGSSFTDAPGGTANWAFTDVTGNYNNKAGSVSITITAATPTIVWTNPADIPQGTALSATQLNAAVQGVGGANLLPGSGSLSYLPPVGTVLVNVGPNTLSTSFTSTNQDYKSVGPQNVAINVTNVPPTVAAIVAPTDPVPLGSPITINTSFSDPGGSADNPYAVVINWGKDPISGLPISPTNTSASAPGPISQSHTYTAAGIYTITVTVTDKNGGVGSNATTNFVVVYDPSGGFVTGGGWINSPAGAYAADPTLTGKATFGFVSKYQKGQSTPDGNTEFQFHEGNLDFSSTSYEWLVINGAKAQFKGSGTINGTGNYGFMLTAIDGGLKGKGNPDTFRIKIVNKSTGATIYDNLMSSDDTLDPTTILGGGSIQIHN